MLVDLKAKEHCCEAEVIRRGSTEVCNQPAVLRMFAPENGASYRMCADCAEWGIEHRGMTMLGAYRGEPV